MSSSMFRSQHMAYCVLYVQPDAVFYILSNLGDMGCVQFNNMNPDVQAFQRAYVSEICRCSELERRLHYLESEMLLYKIQPKPVRADIPAMTLKDLGQFESTIEKWENDLSESSRNYATLMKSYLELTEFFYVLKYIEPMLGEADIWKSQTLGDQGAKGDIGGRLVVFSGVITRKRSYFFEKMLWRISHGIMFYKQASEDKILVDPKTLSEIRKVAFLAIFQGEELALRVSKICDGFGVNLYPCPKSYVERLEMMKKLELRINDMDQVLNKTRYLRCKALREISRNLDKWLMQIRKCKAIYYTMNNFTLDITKKCLIGECWVAENDIKNVQQLLREASEKYEANVPSFMCKIQTLEKPPTYHHTNKFTKGFQNIINAYGDATYEELNAGVYTIITFPFLFSIMFGDGGHGIILLVFAAWMCINEKKFSRTKTNNEIWNIFFTGRYVLLLMGLFSIYAGFLFNDFFSRSISIRRSAWRSTNFSFVPVNEKYVLLDPKAIVDTYYFGVDPMWMQAKNKIMFLNSLKMKLSIILGIFHMMFGLTLSLCNHIYFHKKYAILTEFIPQMIFLMFLFLWLVILIYLKWFKYGARYEIENAELGSACAPQILILFIDMALFSKTKPSVEGCTTGYMFENQRTVQMCLVVTAFICVPIMLFGTPLYKKMTYKKKLVKAEENLKSFQQLKIVDLKTEGLLRAKVEKYSISMAEVMIHQGVHTIEFVLSTISHTASYLRLWALSLAHSQLSEMLWDMILGNLALHDTSRVGSVKIFIFFGLWAFFSVSILVVMEGLSAFLHTLRLHWVEFMSKFFIGNGIPFRPYAFKTMLKNLDKQKELGCKIRNEQNE